MRLQFSVLKEIMECMENAMISPNDDILIETSPFSDDFSIGTKNQVVKYDYATGKMCMRKRKIVTEFDETE